MKYLQILNWALFAAGALMALVLGVVCLILVIYQEEAAALGTNLSQVSLVCVTFLAFALVAGLASWSLYRRHALMWVGQGALLGAMAMLTVLFNNL